MPNKRVRRKASRRKPTKTIQQYARINSSNPTPAELKLWTALKKEMKSWPVEYVFQGILLNRYIGDFVCYEKQVVVEIDGSIHNLKHIKLRDKIRTMELKSNGFYVYRFTNQCVFKHTYSVIQHMKRLVLY